MEFIKFKTVSLWLSGGSTSVRENKVPICHQPAVDKLNYYIEEWKKEFKKFDINNIEVVTDKTTGIKTEELIKEKKEKPTTSIEQVIKEHTIDPFKQLTPSLPCITKNKHCYRVNKVIIGKGVFTEYFYDLDQAKDYCDNLI